MYHSSVRGKVRKLRQERGLTFREIKTKLPYLSKATISNWVRDIVLGAEQEKRILKKRLKNKIEFQLHNKRKHEKALRDTQNIMSKAAREIGRLSARDLKVAGAALFWAEGYNKSDHVIEFANSNPKIIFLIMRFFREILRIDEKRFRCKMTIHPGIIENKCLEFWSKLTSIPRTQFNKTWTKPPKSSSGKMHNILYNGTVVIRISDTNKLRQLKGYIKALI